MKTEFSKQLIKICDKSVCSILYCIPKQNVMCQTKCDNNGNKQAKQYSKIVMEIWEKSVTGWDFGDSLPQKGNNFLEFERLGLIQNEV